MSYWFYVSHNLLCRDSYLYSYWKGSSSSSCYHQPNINVTWPHQWPLIRWGWVTQICISKLTIIGSDNGLAPGWRQTINWTNDGILLIGPLGINFSFNRNSNNFIQVNALENVCEIAFILSWPQCAKSHESHSKATSPSLLCPWSHPQWIISFLLVIT